MFTANQAKSFMVKKPVKHTIRLYNCIKHRARMGYGYCDYHPGWGEKITEDKLNELAENGFTISRPHVNKDVIRISWSNTTK